MAFRSEFGPVIASGAGQCRSRQQGYIVRMKNTKVKRSADDEWEHSWQEHWSKVGLPGYELPVGGPGGDEREFLSQSRTPAKERARLKRINDEFASAFKALYPLGPAV